MLGTTMPTYRVVKWYHQPALPATPPPGPLDVAVWRLLWRVFAVKPRLVATMARLLGLTDGPPLSFRETAELVGVSGSRVGQVYHQLLRAAAAVGPPRSLHRALARLARGPVRTVADASQQLVDGRTTTAPLSCDAIAAIAGLWRLPVTFQIREASSGTRLLVPQDAAADVDAWLADVASRCVNTPVALAPVRRPRQVPRQLAAPLADTHPRIAVSEGVAWSATHLPIVGRLAARALHAGPQSLDSLQEAMRRTLATHHDLPPPPGDVLRTYLAAMPWADLRRGRVTLAADPPVPPSRSDRILLDRLPPGATARWSELVGQLSAAGYSASSAAAALRISPVVEQTDDNRYHRRGAPPQPL